MAPIKKDHYSGGTLHSGDSTGTQQTVDCLQCLAALSPRCCFFLAIIIQMGRHILATVLGHIKQWTVCSACCHSLRDVAFSVDVIQMGYYVLAGRNTTGL
jgi:hypothetical protein